MSRLSRASRVAARRFLFSYRHDHAEPFTWTYWLAWLTIAGSVLYFGFAIFTDIGAAGVQVDIPVRADWTPLAPGAKFDGGPAHITDGSVTMVHVTDSGPTAAARVWLAIGHLLVATTWVWVALVARALIRRVRSGNPFVPALSRAFRRVAIVVMVGGIASQVCLRTATTIVSWDTLGSGWGASSPTSIAVPSAGTMVGLPFSDVSIGADFWPIGVGLVLLVIARVIRIGERIQRDTEGLV